MRSMKARQRKAAPLSRTPISLRLSHATRQAVQMLARQRGESMHATLQRLIDEGARQARCPGIVFADGPAGRRASIAGTGIDVWELARTLRSCGGDEAALRALYPQLNHSQVTAALRYAKTYAQEIEDRIALAEALETEAMETVPQLKVS